MRISSGRSRQFLQHLQGYLEGEGENESKDEVLR